MENDIHVKCPVCGVPLAIKNVSGITKKMVTCPNCKEKRPFSEFRLLEKESEKTVDDETRVTFNINSAPGYFLDRDTGMKYELKEGRFTIGRKPANSPPKADIPILTTDMGMSRVHMTVDVAVARDSRYHVYVSNAENKNPSYVNGELLTGDDSVGLNNGDIVKLCKTELEYRGTVVDDRTELTYKKK